MMHGQLGSVAWGEYGFDGHEKAAIMDCVKIMESNGLCICGSLTTRF